jgi:hypothetical protein
LADCCHETVALPGDDDPELLDEQAQPGLDRGGSPADHLGLVAHLYANRVAGGIAMAREKKTNGDPIVAEVRKIKDRLAAQYDYDAKAMLRDAMRRQKRQGRKVVTLAKRPVSGR